MTYTLAQSTNFNDPIDFDHLTLTQNTVIGNLGLLAFCYSANDTLTTCTSGGTTYTKGGGQTDATNNQKVEWWWAIITAVAGGIDFTDIEASTAAYAEINCDVGFAASPLRDSDSSKAFATTSATANAETSNSITTVAGDLVAAFFGDTGSNQASITPGTGWTAGATEIGVAGTGASAVEYLAAAGTSQSATLTVGTAGHNYTMQIAAFIPLATGPSLPGLLQTEDHTRLVLLQSGNAISVAT
jgi:hypothetical protein